MRLLVGADHRVVLPASALFGAAFLVGCDVARADADRAGRDPGGRHHGADWRAVLSVAAGAGRRSKLLHAARFTVATGRVHHARVHHDDAKLTKTTKKLASSSVVIVVASCHRDRVGSRRAPQPRVAASAARAHHLAHPRRHRDAVRDRRGTAGRRRQQLRRLPARGAHAPARRRAARSRSRAHPVAPSRPRHRLREPGRPAPPARTRDDPDVRLQARRRWPTSRRRSASSARASAATRARRADAGASTRSSRTSGRASRAGPGRGPCWSLAATRSRCAASTPAAASASCTTCSTAAGGDNVFADVKQQSVQATIGAHPGAAPGRHPRAALRQPRGRAAAEGNRRLASAARRSRRCARAASPSSPTRARLSPVPRVAEGTELIARTLHPEAFLK